MDKQSRVIPSVLLSHTHTKTKCGTSCEAQLHLALVLACSLACQLMVVHTAVRRIFSILSASRFS